jgi:hypothetical protein
MMGDLSLCNTWDQVTVCDDARKRMRADLKDGLMVKICDRLYVLNALHVTEGALSVFACLWHGPC